jgi:hypothetical protein
MIHPLAPLTSSPPVAPKITALAPDAFLQIPSPVRMICSPFRKNLPLRFTEKPSTACD